jgi:hypothetical protein
MMKKDRIPPSGENDILTYRRIRKAIGWLGIALPVTLVVLSLIPVFKTGIQESISDYYYTNLRELLTGILCAVALFLIRYRGFRNKQFWKNDSLMTNIAGLMALGVALVPTNPSDCSLKIYTLIPVCASWIGWIHYFFAGSFFLILANVSINVFTIGQSDNREIPLSFLNENNIYRFCGYAMILFLILVPVFDAMNLFRTSTLLLEALMLFAFGISWLVKGRFLGDSGSIGRMLYREEN